MRREIELQLNCPALKQLEQGVERPAVLAQKVHNLSQYRFADEHRGLHLFHKGDSPLMMRIVTIEVGEEGTRVTNRDHGRRNRRRALVAGS